MNASSAAVHELLQDMDGLFDELLTWLAGQYDAESGGFYYARSSRLLRGRRPDIESTAQALNMLHRLELLALMPDTMRNKMIGFFRSNQDPATGYFYDQDPAMRKDEVMVARAIGYSLNALHMLGSKPLYPLPYKAEQAPEYMQSLTAYEQWLRSVDLSNSWRGCDRLACSSVYVKELDKPRQGTYAETAFRFFSDIQDKESGLWGEGSLYIRISGTFKLHTYYSSFGEPMPLTGQMYASILYALRHEEAMDMCFIRNPVNLLSYIRPVVTESELRFIMETTTYNMSRLLRRDGGFSRELAHSPSAPNVAQVKDGAFYPDMPLPVHLSEGKVEGDMNAATQALLIRSLCCRHVGYSKPLLNEHKRKSFYGLIEERA